MRWQFWIDVGGTFTDCVARPPASKSTALQQHKTLSSGVIKGVAGAGSSELRVVDRRRRHDPDNIWTGLKIRTQHGEYIVDQFESGVLHLRPVRDSVGDSVGSLPLRENRYEIVTDSPAPLVAIRYLLGASWKEPLPPVEVRLGTTRGTNALLTRSGSRTALIVSEGLASP